MVWAGFFASGMAALAYEVCWIRKAALVFGVASFAVATVLAVYLGGMALGAHLAARWLDRVRRPLRVYAGVEIAIGILGLLSPAAFRLADSAYGAWYDRLSGSFAALSAVRFVLSGLVILPPTILMGATLPLVCRHYVGRSDRVALPVGLLYGWNTLGAMVGCALCGFILIPRLGVNATLVACGVVNIAVGLAVWALRMPRMPDVAVAAAASSTATPEQPARGRRRRIVFALFFLTGFVVLGNEVLWTRFLSLMMRTSVHTYTLMLTIVLAGIVIGSTLAAAWFDRLTRRGLIFGLISALIGIGVLTLLTLPAAFWQTVGTTGSTQPRLGLLSIGLLVPAALSGAAFPLAIRMVTDDPRLAGATVGQMSAVNLAGCIAGSLTVGFVGLPLLGMHASLLVTTVLSLAMAVVACIWLEQRARPLTRAGLAALMVAAWRAAATVGAARLPADYLADRDRLVAFREGRGSNLAVLRSDGRLSLEIDRWWQGDDRKNHQIVAAHLPMLLHPDPRRVAVVGVGTGQTPSRFLLYGIERLDCLEIEPALFELIREHYPATWLDDPRVRVIVEDGRNYLTHAGATYDVISIEVGQVFRPGVAGFYTREFYERAAARLNPGGVISQFLPAAFVTPDELKMLVATFIEVFPGSVLWYNTSELLLIGTTGQAPSLTPARLALLTGDDRIRDDLAFAHWGGPAHWLNQPAALLGGFLCGPQGLSRLAAGASIYRDDRPTLEYAAARERPTHEAAIVELLKACLDPPSVAMPDAPHDVISAAIAMRQKNLNDIVADALSRPVDRLKERGGYAAIASLLDQALGRNPENARLNRLRADAAFLRGQIEPAIDWYRRSIAIDPNEPRAHYGLGSVLQQAGRSDEALVHLGEAVRLGPRDAQMLHALGVALIRTNRAAAAVEPLREATRLRPSDAEIRSNLATALLLADRAEESVEIYRGLLRERPADAELHHHLGLALGRLGRSDEAIASFDAALRLKPDHAKAREFRNRLMADREKSALP